LFVVFIKCRNYITFTYSFMNYILNNEDLEDHQEWLDGMEQQEPPDIKEAVKIQDPISNMRLSEPLIIELGTSLRHVLNKMQESNNNCVLTIKDEALGGILTERDILLKVTGKGFDLDLTVIDEFITLNPESVTPEDPLAYALNKMHIGGFRNVPVVNDELYPIGIISITDIIATIADYFHSEIINLPPLDKLVDTTAQEGG
jgi:CBS domain-containing protein